MRLERADSCVVLTRVWWQVNLFAAAPEISDRQACRACYKWSMMIAMTPHYELTGRLVVAGGLGGRHVPPLHRNRVWMVRIRVWVPHSRR